MASFPIKKGSVRRGTISVPQNMGPGVPEVCWVLYPKGRGYQVQAQGCAGTLVGRGRRHRRSAR